MMFIGEGPGKEEEKEGRPFMNTAGKKILRRVLTSLGIDDYHYLTNLVTCRSCEQATDKATGLPRFFSGRGRGPALPVLNDMSPTPPQWKACLTRLHEEIYLVDPAVIVSLGGTAAEALTGGPITITRDHGRPIEIKVPGAGFEAQLTETRKVWTRKVGGELVSPVKQNEVGYLLIPTFHQEYIERKIADLGHDSVFKKFVEDIKRAVRIYEMYLMEAYGYTLTWATDKPFEAVSRDYSMQENSEES